VLVGRRGLGVRSALSGCNAYVGEVYEGVVSQFWMIGPTSGGVPRGGAVAVDQPERILPPAQHERPAAGIVLAPSAAGPKGEQTCTTDILHFRSGRSCLSGYTRDTGGRTSANQDPTVAGLLHRGGSASSSSSSRWPRRRLMDVDGQAMGSTTAVFGSRHGPSRVIRLWNGRLSDGGTRVLALPLYF